MASDENELMDARTAAEQMGVTPAWVRRLAKQGRIPGMIKVAGRYAIRRGDFEQFLRIYRGKAGEERR